MIRSRHVIVICACSAGIRLEGGSTVKPLVDALVQSAKLSVSEVNGAYDSRAAEAYK